MGKPSSHSVQYRLLLGGFLMVMIGCSTTNSTEQRSSTTKPEPVDEVTDNGTMLSQMVPGLVVGLDITGDVISIVYTRVMLVPKPSPQSEGTELITVTGLREGKISSTAHVSDLRLTVREGFGKTQGALLTMEKRTVTTALPLPVRIDMLEVRLPGNREPIRQDLREIFDRHCTSNRQSMLC